MYIAPLIGDVSADQVRGPWASNPFVLVEWDWKPPGGIAYPRTFTVVLLVVEEDNQALSRDLLPDHRQGRRKGAREGRGGCERCGRGPRGGRGRLGHPRESALWSARQSAAWPEMATTSSSPRSGMGCATRSSPRSRSPSRPTTPTPTTETEQSLHIQQFGAHYELGYDWHFVR